MMDAKRIRPDFSADQRISPHLDVKRRPVALTNASAKAVRGRLVTHAVSSQHDCSWATSCLDNRGDGRRTRNRKRTAIIDLPACRATRRNEGSRQLQVENCSITMDYGCGDQANFFRLIFVGTRIIRATVAESIVSNSPDAMSALAISIFFIAGDCALQPLRHLLQVASYAVW